VTETQSPSSVGAQVKLRVESLLLIPHHCTFPLHPASVPEVQYSTSLWILLPFSIEMTHFILFTGEISSETLLGFKGISERQVSFSSYSTDSSFPDIE